MVLPSPRPTDPAAPHPGAGLSRTRHAVCHPEGSECATLPPNIGDGGQHLPAPTPHIFPPWEEFVVPWEMAARSLPRDPARFGVGNLGQALL